MFMRTLKSTPWKGLKPVGGLLPLPPDPYPRHAPQDDEAPAEDPIRVRLHGPHGRLPRRHPRHRLGARVLPHTAAAVSRMITKNTKGSMMPRMRKNNPRTKT